MLKDLTVKLGADFTIFERALGNMQQGISKMQTSVQTFAARVDTSMKAAEKSFEEFAKKPQEAADSISGIGENINTYFALPMIAAAGASIKFASDKSTSGIIYPLANELTAEKSVILRSAIVQNPLIYLSALSN